jgi:hypothetical protein
LTLQLPNLTYAYSLEINNASEIDLPMLTSVSDGLSISYSKASALNIPELTYVGGDLVVSGNPYLDNFLLNELVNVQGDLEIIDNEALADLDGLPYLSSVGGDLRLMGAFDKYVLWARGIVGMDTDCSD